MNLKHASGADPAPAGEAAPLVRADPPTRWQEIALLLGCGVGAALHAGKVPPALPSLLDELHLSIVQAAWVLSLLSAVGALAGFFAGRVTDRLGARRVAVVGLICMAAASYVGAMAQGAALLLASRAVEGLGFLLAVVAIPTVLGRAAAPSDRRFVSALWGIYMPTGLGVALVGAPLLLHAGGWRYLWRVCALLAALLAACLVATRAAAAPARQAVAQRQDVRWDRAAALRLALIFCMYTLQYLAVLGFLPTLLHQQGISIQQAGNLTAGVALANAAGNLLAGVLMTRHFRPAGLIGAGSLVMAVAALGIYLPAVGPFARYLLLLAFSLCGGLLPASVFASVPAAARGAGAAGTVMGLVVQGSNIGQLLGPPLAAAVAERAGGWQLTPVVLLPAALIALLAARGLPRSGGGPLSDPQRAPPARG
ncbi:MAG: MFS transporter [Proteobacteria bacterium]|nr:MFS transporter [Pseudomonadota bacterium]